MQANLGRGKLATTEIFSAGLQRKAMALLLSEPYVGSVGQLQAQDPIRIVQNNILAGPNKAAIAILDQSVSLIVDPQLQRPNIAVARLKYDMTEIAIIAVYLEKEKDIEADLKELKIIKNKLAISKIIIGGDFNAWSMWWGSTRPDHRGDHLSAWFTEEDMCILNKGTIPTFEVYRQGRPYASHVDITVCGASLLNKIDEWHVDREVTSSDHNTIIFKMSLLSETLNLLPLKKGTRLYNTKRADWAKFQRTLLGELEKYTLRKDNISDIADGEKVEEAIINYTAAVAAACDASISKLKPPGAKTRPPWWSKELESLKTIMITKKRRIKCAAPRRRNYVIAEYQQAREKYTLMARKAQTTSWQEYCGKSEKASIWDGVYKVLRRTVRPRPDVLLRNSDGASCSPEDSAKLLADTLFPDDDASAESAEHRNIREMAEQEIPSEPDDPPFTATELELSVRSFSASKSPGSDHFTADICEHAVLGDGEVYLELVNTCFKLSYFPVIWKRATVVIIPKPNKEDVASPRSYRPIGLLSILGKIMEKMLICRLRWYVCKKISPRQYGFMPQRSTEDALYDLITHLNKKRKENVTTLLISLDIEGAFDNAWWPSIKTGLLKANCPQNIYRMVCSYLSGRQVNITYAGVSFSKHTNRGCVQGSIAGPTLWNICINSLLTEIENSGIHCQAFADDVVLAVSGNTAKEIQDKAEKVLSVVTKWGQRNKLRFGPQKTCSMLITRKRNFEDVSVKMDGEKLKITDQIKMLGVILDNKLKFGPHVDAICMKLTQLYKKLERAARCTWGLNSDIIRIIYVSVIEPIALYASSIWAPALQVKTIRRKLLAVQRGFVQKIAKAYRTVSLTAALAISGVLPLDIRVTESAHLYEIKRGKRALDIQPDREVESYVPYESLPHPAKQLPKNYALVGKDDIENIMGTHIYTDGSKIDGRVGAALSIWREKREVKYRTLRLDSYCSVFQAELLAIWKATELAESLKTNVINIFSDSRAALDLIKNLTALHPIAFQTRILMDDLRDRGIDVRLHWLRAHVGTRGNERADELAKRAAKFKKTAADYDLYPASYAMRIIRERSIDRWNATYKEEIKHKPLELFLPDVTIAYKFFKFIRPGGLLTQVLTGHGGFGQYLHRFKLRDHPCCVCEPGVIEDVVHVITTCPRFGSQRQDMAAEIGIDITRSNFRTLLTNDKYRKKFIKYCEAITKATGALNGSTAKWLPTVISK